MLVTRPAQPWAPLLSSQAHSAVPQRGTQAPRSAIQKAAQDLGETPDHRVHIDGVRWDIARDASGKLIEQGVFSDAYLNPDKVKDVYLCIKPFTDQPMNLPGHALLEFEFEPDSPVTNSQGGQDPALVVSVEAHMHQAETWTPDTKNPLIYQLGTWKDTLLKSQEMDYHPVDCYKLLWSHDKLVELLKSRLAIATQNHDADLYDAVTNNCLTSIIQGINQIAPEAQQIPLTMPDGSPDPNATVPMWCPNNFAIHGLISHDPPVVFPAKPKPTA